MRPSSRLPSDLAPNPLSLRLEAMQAAGIPLLDLTATNPTDCGLLFPESVLREALSGPEVLRYAPDPRGARSAREAIAAHHGLGLAPEDLVLTASTSEAYAWIFKLLTDPGDEVLVPSPSYPLFEWLARLEGIQARTVPAYFHERWHLDLQAMEEAVTPRTRALILVNPNNPTGHFLSRSEWAALLDMATRHGLALVVDEVFSPFLLEPGPDRLPTALSTREPPCPVFVLSGLSKLVALPQVKLGWIALRGSGSGELMEQLLFLADQYLSVSASAQAAAPRLLREAPARVAHLQHRLARNLAELDAQLRSHPHLSRPEVEGGWSALLRRPALEPDDACALRLLEKARVRVHPGHFFDLPGDTYLVLSLLPEPAVFSEGLQRLLPHLAG